MNLNLFSWLKRISPSSAIKDELYETERALLVSLSHKEYYDSSVQMLTARLTRLRKTQQTVLEGLGLEDIHSYPDVMTLPSTHPHMES